METKLDELIKSIDPEKTMNHVSTRIDDAMNSFENEFGIITDWQTFRSYLTKFYRHSENVALKIKSFNPPDPNIDWGRCVKLLMKEYGPSGGDKAAFEIIRTGAQGGLNKVLKNIAKQMIEEYSIQEIRAKISRFWHSLTVDEQLAATEEYLAKYGHLLPSELTERSAARIKANFVKVLEEHPKTIKRLRNIGR